jgi:hypothetical protein
MEAAWSSETFRIFLPSYRASHFIRLLVLIFFTVRTLDFTSGMLYNDPVRWFFCVNCSVNIVLVGRQYIDTLNDGAPLQRTPIATCFNGICFFVQDSPLTLLVQTFLLELYICALYLLRVPLWWPWGCSEEVRRRCTTAWLNFITTWYVSFTYKLKLTGVIHLNSVWVINREEPLVHLNSEVKTKITNWTRQSGIAVSTEVTYGALQGFVGLFCGKGEISTCLSVSDTINLLCLVPSVWIHEISKCIQGW